MLHVRLLDLIVTGQHNEMIQSLNLLAELLSVVVCFFHEP